MSFTPRSPSNRPQREIALPPLTMALFTKSKRFFFTFIQYIPKCNMSFVCLHCNAKREGTIMEVYAVCLIKMLLCCS